MRDWITSSPPLRFKRSVPDFRVAYQQRLIVTLAFA